MGKLDLMKSHVDTVCQQNEIQVERRRPGANARAFRDIWMIQIPPVRGPVSYAVALHEIGHMDAWRWARRNAVVEWTEAMALRARFAQLVQVSRVQMMGPS